MWATSCDRWLIGAVVVSLVFLGQSLVNAACVQNQCIVIELAVYSSPEGIACYKMVPKDCLPCWGGRDKDNNPIKGEEGECDGPGAGTCFPHASNLTDWHLSQNAAYCILKCNLAVRGYSEASPKEGITYDPPKSYTNWYCKGIGGD